LKYEDLSWFERRKHRRDTLNQAFWQAYTAENQGSGDIGGYSGSFAVGREPRVDALWCCCLVLFWSCYSGSAPMYYGRSCSNS